jgi:hypothetical protein
MMLWWGMGGWGAVVKRWCELVVEAELEGEGFLEISVLLPLM